MVIDGRGRWAIPGLIDTHTHFLNTGISSVRAALYHGVTTVREMWHPLGESAAFRDAVAAGAVDGARVVVSGPPVYPAPAYVPPVTSDFLWIPVDSATGERALTMLRAFGDPRFVTLKQHVTDAVLSGAHPSAIAVTDQRFVRTNIRVTLRQLKASQHEMPSLAAWLAAHERSHHGEGADDQHLHEATQ